MTKKRDDKPAVNVTSHNQSGGITAYTVNLGLPETVNVYNREVAHDSEGRRVTRFFVDVPTPIPHLMLRPTLPVESIDVIYNGPLMDYAMRSFPEGLKARSFRNAHGKYVVQVIDDSEKEMLLGWTPIS